MSFAGNNNPVLTPWPKHPYDDPEKCEFCNMFTTSLYSFQGRPICGSCNEKLIERIKLILKFE